MGESRVKLASTNKQIQIFEQHLLKDIYALERMLDEGWFEIDITRIGAEQEFCLVDKNWKAAPINMEVLEKLDDPLFVTELAKFNVEANLPPLVFEGDCLSVMENNLLSYMRKAQVVAESFNSNTILTGIIPTIRKHDVAIHNITPIERYFALCKAIDKLRGSKYELRIHGTDELIFRHDSPLLEAANTGFQVHLQIPPHDFVKMYNIAQAITGPVLAASTNSPLLFGKRLWHETRVALFQQSVDTRQTSDHLRETSPRVTFGNDWLRNSILDIYREDIVRYRILLSTEAEEDVSKKLESGTAPKLTALNIHNGTVYRWNRPCYGISEGKAHLRIENRVFPSGPTVIDEVANAALWLGLMKGYQNEIEDVTTLMDFADARANFINASQTGLNASMYWFDGKTVPTSKLIIEEMIPVAEQGLESMNIDKADIEKYLSVIYNRVSSGSTGSTWVLRSYNNLIKSASSEEVCVAVTAASFKNQQENIPVHQWKNAELDDIPEWIPSSMLVEEVMTRDLFTVQKDDILQLVTDMMNWQKVRYIPVEDAKGRLVGLISTRVLLKKFATASYNNGEVPLTAKDAMQPDVVSINPEANIMEAMAIMEKFGYGCLPVVNNNKLVGIVTEQNFLQITNRLLKRSQQRKK
ncbi:MAG: CBS domain-containing protein [Chitinophagales bacterium]|nr:CBS domain-containing protein [Chitinophagales bacterium]